MDDQGYYVPLGTTHVWSNFMKVFFGLMVFTVFILFLFVIKADACAAGNLGVNACSGLPLDIGTGNV